MFLSVEQFEIATRERNLEVLQLGPHGITIYASKEVCFDRYRPTYILLINGIPRYENLI